MAAKHTRLTHQIAIQLHLVAESYTVCSSCSRRPVRKLLVTPSFVIVPCNSCWTGGQIFEKFHTSIISLIGYLNYILIPYQLSQQHGRHAKFWGGKKPGVVRCNCLKFCSEMMQHFYLAESNKMLYKLSTLHNNNN
jgi:hypothetical protein